MDIQRNKNRVSGGHLMSKVPFNVSAKTARLIGRENVSNIDGALIELIKNTYDADAKDCIVYFENSTKTLMIIDNGIGMSQEIVINNWMTIGNSSKVENFVTDSGRIQTGEKGIGRFALDRIAEKCKMHTVSEKSNYNWTIDWEEFSDNKLLTDTYAEIENSEDTIRDFCQHIKNNNLKAFINEKFTGTGTCFILENLRDDWNSSLILKLQKALSKLLPPAKIKKFHLYFFAETSEKKDAEIKSAFLGTFDYKVEFKLSDLDICNIKIFRNEFDFGNDFDKIMNEAGFSSEDREYFKGKPIISKENVRNLLPGIKDNNNLDLGTISGELYFYKLITQEKNVDKFYYKEFSARQADFKEISGVKIYRDNFIVRPYGFYGSTGYDWLSLSTRKAESPAGIAHPKGAWKVQANQMCGQLFISRLNKNLPDKSSREGIVETNEFLLFREFVLKLISLFENDRQYVIRKLDNYNKKVVEGEAALENTKQVLEEYTQSYKNEGNSQDQSEKESKSSNNYYTHFEDFKKAFDYQEEKIGNLEEEMGLLRTLATTGIVVNTYIHEIKALTTKMNMGIKEAYELLKEENDKDSAILELSKLRELRNDFNSWFKVTLDSVQKDRRTMKKHNVNQIIIRSTSTWERVQKNTITYTVLEEKTINVRCFPFDFESIINNLITNSSYVFKTNGTNTPTIKIVLGSKDDYYFINYSDNGPGLCQAFKDKPNEILKQGITDKRDANQEIIGTGMGLWIVNNIIQDYNGYIDLSVNKSVDSGFSIGLFFKGR
jgi:hypothetical protein